MTENDPITWWGDLTLEMGQTANWEIASLRVALERLPKEWLVSYQEREAKSDETSWRFWLDDTNLQEEPLDKTDRIVSLGTSAQLSSRPALPDRSMVTRPFTLFTVPAGESATIYVSTLLWFQVTSGDPAQLLADIPILRPSDTWFGPSTQEGEVCYASRTYGRLNLDNIEIYPHRALTQIHIHNRASSKLLVERLSLPVPYLSIFTTNEGALWTEAVTMTRTRETALEKFTINDGPPPSAPEAELIVPPRQKPQKDMLIRAFSVLTLQGF